MFSALLYVVAIFLDRYFFFSFILGQHLFFFVNSNTCHSIATQEIVITSVNGTEKQHVPLHEGSLGMFLAYYISLVCLCFPVVNLLMGAVVPYCR